MGLPEDRTQVVRLGRKRLYSLNHLIGPNYYFDIYRFIRKTTNQTPFLLLQRLGDGGCGQVRFRLQVYQLEVSSRGSAVNKTAANTFVSFVQQDWHTGRPAGGDGDGGRDRSLSIKVLRAILASFKTRGGA